MTNLIPIKVKVLQNFDGSFNYPDFSQLQIVKSKNFKQHSFTRGIRFDKRDNMDINTIDSPIGMKWGLKFVTQEFYDEVIQKFSNRIVRLSEIEVENLWNNGIQKDVPKINRELNILQGLKIEKDLLVDLGQSIKEIDIQILKALDPNDIEPGITINKQKYWINAKVEANIKII